MDLLPGPIQTPSPRSLLGGTLQSLVGLTLALLVITGVVVLAILALPIALLVAAVTFAVLLLAYVVVRLRLWYRRVRGAATDPRRNVRVRPPSRSTDVVN